MFLLLGREGPFLLITIAFSKGPLGRSLRSFARSHHSLHSLAPLASLTRSVHGLAHSLRSLPFWTLEFLKICVHAVNAFKGKKRIFGHH